MLLRIICFIFVCYHVKHYLGAVVKHIAIGVEGRSSIPRPVKSDTVSPTALWSCVAYWLRRRDGPLRFLHALALYREYHEDLI